MSSELCPCGTKKPFQHCCARFLEQGLSAKTPEQLMRSRFSAYARGNYGEYLLTTWFPATAQGLSAEELSEKSVDWQKLEIIDKGQKGDEGHVEFKAYFKNSDGELDVMHEASEFKRVKGVWLYVGGRVS